MQGSGSKELSLFLRSSNEGERTAGSKFGSQILQNFSDPLLAEGLGFTLTSCKLNHLPRGYGGTGIALGVAILSTRAQHR